MSIAKAKAFWPITITTANRGIRVSFAAGPSETANIATGTYLSATLLAAAVDAALDALHPGSERFNVTVGSTGRFTIGCIDDSISLKWSDPLATAYAILGWTAADTGDAASHTAPNQHQNGWYADVATRKDSLPIRDREADTVTVTKGGQTKFVSEPELARRELRFAFLKPHKTYIQYESTNPNEAIERWWQDGRARFRYWPDGTVEGTYTDNVFDTETIKEFAATRQFEKKALYEISLLMRGYVA